MYATTKSKSSTSTSDPDWFVRSHSSIQLNRFKASAFGAGGDLMVRTRFFADGISSRLVLGSGQSQWER
jgi:hypothetical protein